MRVLKQSEVKSVSGGFFFFKLFLLKKLFHGYGYKAGYGGNQGGYGGNQGGYGGY